MKLLSGSEKNDIPLFDALFFMLLCLFFLICGNIVFHTALLPLNGSATSLLVNHWQPKEIEQSFLSTVLSLSGNDLLCLALVATSGVFKKQSYVICGVFAYKSLLFGYCGAYMASAVCQMPNATNATIAWLLFFLRYIAYFSILIFFGMATANGDRRRGVDKARYVLTVCCEMGLVILINCTYYFLINKL